MSNLIDKTIIKWIIYNYKNSKEIKTKHEKEKNIYMFYYIYIYINIKVQNK
jgi:hypothetical protein